MRVKLYWYLPGCLRIPTTIPRKQKPVSYGMRNHKYTFYSHVLTGTIQRA